MLYSEMQRESIKKEREELRISGVPSEEMVNITKELGIRWKALPEEEKASNYFLNKEYQAMFRLEVGKYHEKMAAFKDMLVNEPKSDLGNAINPSSTPNSPKSNLLQTINEQIIDTSRENSNLLFSNSMKTVINNSSKNLSIQNLLGNTEKKTSPKILFISPAKETQSLDIINQPKEDYTEKEITEQMDMDVDNPIENALDEKIEDEQLKSQ